MNIKVFKSGKFWILRKRDVVMKRFVFVCHLRTMSRHSVEPLSGSKRHKRWATGLWRVHSRGPLLYPFFTLKLFFPPDLKTTALNWWHIVKLADTVRHKLRKTVNWTQYIQIFGRTEQRVLFSWDTETDFFVMKKKKGVFAFVNTLCHQTQTHTHSECMSSPSHGRKK